MSVVRRSFMNVNGEKDIEFPSTYFTTYARETGSITLTIAKSVSTDNIQYISYSTDEGTTWVTTNNVSSQVVAITTPEVPQGTFIYWKGKGTTMGSGSEGCNIVGSAKFDIGGDLASLIHEDDYETNHAIGFQGYKVLFQGSTNLVHAKHLDIIFDGDFPGYGLLSTFKNCTSLIDTPNIQWDSFASTSYQALNNTFANCTALEEVSHAFPRFDFTYNGQAVSMFQGCTSLKKVPDIHVDVTRSECFKSMFDGCSSLIHCPLKSVPNVLAQSCFTSMFNGCTSMVDAPVLSSTELATSCYSSMFKRTAIATAPILSVETLVNNCYGNMFESCPNISYIKMLATDISASNCLAYWLRYAKNTIDCVFVKHIDAAWTTSGISGVPDKWKIIYYDPALDKYYTDQTRATECDDHGNPI